MLSSSNQRRFFSERKTLHESGRAHGVISNLFFFIKVFYFSYLMTSKPTSNDFEILKSNQSTKKPLKKVILMILPNSDSLFLLESDARVCA